MVSADVDVVEEIFDLLVLWHFFGGLSVELLQHFVELFKAEVSSSRVVPLDITETILFCRRPLAKSCSSA